MDLDNMNYFIKHPLLAAVTITAGGTTLSGAVARLSYKRYKKKGLSNKAALRKAYRNGIITGAVSGTIPFAIGNTVIPPSSYTRASKWSAPFRTLTGGLYGSGLGLMMGKVGTDIALNKYK